MNAAPPPQSQLRQPPPNAPLVSLVPVARRPSSGINILATPRRVSPTSSSQPPTPTSATPSSSGLPSFRGLRAFFSKQPQTPNANTGAEKTKSGPFTGLGGIRRSTSGGGGGSGGGIDGKQTQSAPVSAVSADEQVLAIVPGGGIPASPQSGSISDLSPSPRATVHDLSTIIESDMSGISRHLPPSSSASEQGDADSPTDALNLATVQAEVHAAMARRPSAAWSARSDSQPLGGTDASFDLSSVDPDLEALLSPHRHPKKLSADDAVAYAVDALLPPTLSPASSTSNIPEIRLAPSTSLLQEPAPSFTSRRSDASRILRAADDSPLRRAQTPPTSIGASPRLLRSNADYIAHSEPASPAQTSPYLRQREIARNSIDRHSPRMLPSALARSEGIIPGADDRLPRLDYTRFVTPSRPSTSGGMYSSAGPSTVRPSLARLRTSSSGRWEEDTPSARPARAPSSLSTSLGRRFHASRPSMDSGSLRAHSAVSEFGTGGTLHSLGGGGDRRRRSLSINQTPFGGPPRSPSDDRTRQMSDTLGPRTQRAFAAAGLLPARSGSPHSPSRLGGGGNDIAQYFDGPRSGSSMSLPRAPSRSVSEAGGGPYPRRSSLSRTLTPEALLYYPGRRAPGDSPGANSVVTTPRSVGGASTAYTSVSAGSVVSGPGGGSSASSTAGGSDETRALRDKHHEQVSALLSALAASQKSVVDLTAENTDLKNAVIDLTRRLEAAQMQIVEERDVRSNARYTRTPRWDDVPSHYGSPVPPRHHTRTRKSPAVEYAELGLGPQPHPHRRAHSRTHSRAQAFNVPYDSHASTSEEDERDADDTIIRRSRPPMLQQRAVSYSHVRLRDAAPPPAPSRHERRNSIASSIFPLPPSNMSMLLHEDALPERTHLVAQPSFSSADPPSPTLPRPALGQPAHRRTAAAAARHRELSICSSASELSTSGMSLINASLRLRPEDEAHLREMEVLSLDLGSPDEFGHMGF